MKPHAGSNSRNLEMHKESFAEKCGNTDHYWLKTVEKYQCKKCKTRTSLRSGTVMQESNLPFRHWFIAIHLLTGKVLKRPFLLWKCKDKLGINFTNQFGI